MVCCVFQYCSVAVFIALPCGPVATPLVQYLRRPFWARKLGLRSGGGMAPGTTRGTSGGLTQCLERWTGAGDHKVQELLVQPPSRSFSLQEPGETFYIMSRISLQIGLITTLITTVITMCSIAQLWDDEWDMVAISLQVRSSAGGWRTAARSDVMARSVALVMPESAVFSGKQS